MPYISNDQPGARRRDIVIALTAQQQQLTLIHADAVFESIANIRPGIAMIRIDQ